MSQKLQLDFIQRPLFSLQKISHTGLGFLLSGLVLASLVGVYYQALWSRYQLAQADLVRIDLVQAQPTATIATSQQNSSVAVEELQQARAVAEELMMPWPTLLSTLERIEPKNIALLGITPNKKKQQLQLTGQAKNMQAALQYIQQLEATPMLSQVYLQKHEVEVDDAFKPVSFTIMASW